MRVFLSYTRTKDAFGGATAFRKHLEAELKLLEPAASVFQDTRIEAGDDWAQELEDQVNKADVLLALISPAWRTSDWCRKEFDLFTRKETLLGRAAPRVLPVLWVSSGPDENGDPNTLDLRRVQYADWRELREKPRSSGRRQS